MRGDSGFGTYTLTAAGVWTYTLDNSNAAVQALNVGQTLTDTFTAFTVDGTSQVVTITINGTNDAAVISGDRNGHGDRGRRCRQRHAGHAHRDRRSQLHRRRQSERRLAAVGTATASANGYGTFTLTRPACGPTRSTTAMPPCRRSTSATR